MRFSNSMYHRKMLKSMHILSLLRVGPRAGRSRLFHLEGELSFFASAVGLDDDVAFSFGGVIEGAVHGLARLQR